MLGVGYLHAGHLAGRRQEPIKARVQGGDGESYCEDNIVEGEQSKEFSSE